MGWRVSLAILRVLGTLIPAATIFAWLSQAFKFPLTSFLEIALMEYDLLLYEATRRFEPFLATTLSTLSDLVRFDLELGEHWRYAAVPMFLYFNTDIVTNFRRGRWANLASGVIIGWPLAILGGLRFTESTELAVPRAAAFAPAAAMLGLAAWSLVQPFLTSVFHRYVHVLPDGRKAHASFAESISHHLRNTFLPMTVIAACSFVIGAGLGVVFVAITPERAVTLAFLVFLVGTSCWWILLASRNSKRQPAHAPKPMREFPSYRFGVHVLWIVATVAAGVAFNALLIMVGAA
jgi:uncharacterized membrane protein YfcA